MGIRLRRSEEVGVCLSAGEKVGAGFHPRPREGGDALPYDKVLVWKEWAYLGCSTKNSPPIAQWGGGLFYNAVVFAVVA